MSKNLGIKIRETKDLERDGLLCADCHGLDHDHASRGLWTRLDVTAGCGFFRESQSQAVLRSEVSPLRQAQGRLFRKERERVGHSRWIWRRADVIEGGPPVPLLALRSVHENGARNRETKLEKQGQAWAEQAKALWCRNQLKSLRLRLLPTHCGRNQERRPREGSLPRPQSLAQY